MSNQAMNLALIRLGKAIERMRAIELPPEQTDIMSEIAARYWEVVNTFVETSP